MLGFLSAAVGARGFHLLAIAKTSAPQSPLTIMCYGSLIIESPHSLFPHVPFGISGAKAKSVVFAFARIYKSLVSRLGSAAFVHENLARFAPCDFP